jgi:hypothetical protein
MTSRTIARILGPSLVVLSAAEYKNLAAFADVRPWFVFLNGNLLLVAGLAIVQSHNIWKRHWSVWITLSGWFLLLAGAYRMFWPDGHQLGPGLPANLTFVVLAMVGMLLSYRGYSRQAS